MATGSLLSETYFGSTIPQYLLFFVVLCIGALLGRSLTFLYRQRLRRKAEATETEVDDIIVYALGRPVILLGIVLGAAAGRYFLTPVEPLRTVVNASVEVPIIVTIAWVAVRLTDGFIDAYLLQYVEQTESKLDDELVPIVSRITNIAIVSIAGVVILDSLGYDVTAVIASLGVVGVAVAFASRKTMADVFGGAHILSAKPFLVDDIVDIEGTTGTVEEIGLRTTRIRDFDGRAVSLPNSAIADAEVRNISSEPTRRVKTFLGLSYDTTPAEMDRAIDLAVDTVNAVDGVDTDQTGAWFWNYGDSALRVRLEYHIDSLDRWKAVRDTVNRDIQEAFEDAGIDMALPTRTVRLEHDGEDVGDDEPASRGEGLGRT
ncbi:MAG: mechanosensitive ion channel family protein [Haloarculaceae archaeon]